MASCSSSSGSSSSEASSRSQSRSRKSKKGRKGGKKRLNGYIKYFMARLKECKDLKVTEVAKIAGKEWCNLSAEKQEEWKRK